MLKIYQDPKAYQTRQNAHIDGRLSADGPKYYQRLRENNLRPLRMVLYYCAKCHQAAQEIAKRQELAVQNAMCSWHFED